jgi:hypothetical protein
MAIQCPANGCNIPNGDWNMGETHLCTECNTELLIVTAEPLKFVEKPPTRYDSPRGDLSADHSGTYTLQELIADIIDNSIDATEPGGTVSVTVDFGTCDYSEEDKEWRGLQGPQRPYIVIRDDAKGMDEETLSRAMGKGHRRDYSPWELGHYGVGLKKSSLSNTYEITVFTKQAGGEVVCQRYSSCYIQKYDHNAVIDKAKVEELFPWMTQTEAWDFAEQDISEMESGTIVLLEGIPTLQKSTGEHLEERLALDAHIDETRAAMGLVFQKYLQEGGATIEYKDPETGKEKSVTKRMILEVDGDEVEPIDPFHADLIDPEDSFATLCKNHKIPTSIEGEEYEIDVNIYIIPNDKHPVFKERSKSTLDSLKLTRKSAEPQTLQGCYVYRNQRLIDYGRDGAWKGAYGSLNMKTTLLRWEVHLPCHRLLGNLASSDWKIDTSKSQAVPTPEMQAQFKDLASKKASQQWHPLDPEYPMAPGVRANRRRGATGNGTVLEPWERWKKGACDLCTDPREGWNHKKKQHKCSYCRKRGHEGPYSSDGKPNKKCTSYVPRPAKPAGDDTSGGGEDGGSENPVQDDSGTGNGGSTSPSSPSSNKPSVVIAFDSESLDPIETSEEAGVRIVKFNKEHSDYPELMEKLTPFVKRWEEEHRAEEEE